MKLFIVCAVFISSIAAADASAVLWRDPGPIETLDLAGGPGGAERAPQPPFTFVSEDLAGTSPKITVKDSRGVNWSVKFGEEAKAETFASRIAWAAGYYADPSYHIGQGEVQNVNSLGRAAAFLQGGRFSGARFEPRDGSARIVPESQWTLDEAGLKGTRELAGLKLLFILLANWDAKPQNMAIVEANGHRFYAVTDWGATMGRAADVTGRSKWNCDVYAKDSKHFVEGAENGFAIFNFQGKQSHAILQGIRLEDVQWFMQRMGRLKDPQIDAALRASGATPQEAQCFGQAFRSRLGQLMTVGQTSPDGTTIRSRTIIKTTKKVQTQQ